MLNVKNTIVDTLLSIIAPHLCSGCGEIGSTFCDNCKYNIIQEPFFGCILCEKLVDSGICDDHKAAFNQAWVVGLRSDSLQRLIGGYKFRYMKAAAFDLADLLDKRLPMLPSNTILVPIPTTPSHIRERGYDHLLLLTERLGRSRNLPVQTVIKRKNTLTQHRANRKQRLIQAATAFRVEGIIDPDSIYVVVDDVITTGATVLEATALLKQRGATTVWVAATSRQPLD